MTCLFKKKQARAMFVMHLRKFYIIAISYAHSKTGGLSISKYKKCKSIDFYKTTLNISLVNLSFLKKGL